MHAAGTHPFLQRSASSSCLVPREKQKQKAKKEAVIQNINEVIIDMNITRYREPRSLRVLVCACVLVCVDT